jgi:hypothetical protein
MFRSLLTALVFLCASTVGAQTLLGGMSGFPHGIPDFCEQDPTATLVPADEERTLSGTVSCLGIHGAVTIAGALTADIILVYEDGALTLADGAVVTIAGQPIDTALDPEQFGTGLLVLGRWRAHGQAKDPFLRLATEPQAGDTVLVLEQPPVGWRVGDRIAIPDSRHLANNEIGGTPNKYVPQWEERTIADVTGEAIALNAPLTYTHPGARNAVGTLEFLPHVANLSRSITIRSANPNGTRGHVLVAHMADVDVSWVRFENLGRTTVEPLDSTTYSGSGTVTHVGTNQIGRYPLHFHHTFGPMDLPTGTPQFKAVGLVVEGSPKWGITVHNSHHGLIQDCVAYNVNGAGFNTEDGNESFNVFDHNFSLRGYGIGGRDALGREGVGFFFRGPHNYVRNNVSSDWLSGGKLPFDPQVGDSAYGFLYYTTYLGKVRIPKGPGLDTTNDANVTIRDGNNLPLLQFENNEVYGASESGVSYWWLGSSGNSPYVDAPEAVFKNTRIWHVYNKGVFHYPSSHVTLDGLVIRGGSNMGACCGVGVHGADYFADRLVIRHADIQNMKTGISFSTNAGTNPAPQLVEDSYLNNLTNLRVQTITTSAYRSDGMRPMAALVTNTVLAQPTYWFTSQTYHPVEMRYVNVADNPSAAVVQVTKLRIVNPGDVYDVYFTQQAPDFIVPQTTYNSDGTIHLWGAPAPGLTNMQAWALYSVAVAGAIAPCQTTRQGVIGFVCPAIATPAVPTNMRVR